MSGRSGCPICNGFGNGCPACGQFEADKDHRNLMRLDRPHEPLGTHVDSTIRLPEIGGALKTAINPSGEIFSSEVWIGTQRHKL